LVAPDGEVHSFEPVPTSFRLLEWNVRKLRLRNVRLWQCAASDANGEVLLSIPYHDHGGRNYYRAQVVASAASSAAECVFAEARTLDSIFAGDDRPVTFVKCDVEGHEVSCLRGALDVIRRFQPAWLIEVSGDPDKPETCAADAFRVLRNGGYAPYIHCAGRLHARREGETAVNYVFLSESATARLRNEAVFGDA
jgi:FkbM family methyltransferase